MKLAKPLINVKFNILLTTTLYQVLTIYLLDYLDHKGHADRSTQLTTYPLVVRASKNSSHLPPHSLTLT